MKKQLGLLALLTVAVLILLSFAGCASNEEIATEDFFAGSTTTTDGESAEGITDSDLAGSVSDNRKIIETIDLTVQTKTFDTLMEGINAQIKTLGGYVETSTVSGRKIDANNNRWAEMTIRIPAEKSDAFSGFLSENSVVVSRSVNTEDVTLSYVDMESRVAALEAEKTALEKLLANAETMADIIAVQDQLTDVIYEIESYKSQLRTYDNLVEYTTVNLYISEVERTAVVEEQNVWQKIGTNLSENFANVWNGTVNLFIFAVSVIPYLIPFALIGVIVLVIVKLCTRSAKKKSDKKKDE